MSSPTADGLTSLASEIAAKGELRVLDLGHSAALHGILIPWVHEGTYYLRPPDGMSAAELQTLLDEYKNRGTIHLSYNAQSALDTNHKPILPLDSFAERYFADPPQGIVKATAVARSKVAELNALIDQFKKPFDPSTFPGIGELALAQFKAPAAGRQTVVSLKLMHPDWKRLMAIEIALKHHLSEANLVREIHVGRHSVKGLDPEIMLLSTEETADAGNAFLTAIATQVGDADTLAASHQTPITPEEPGIPGGGQIAREKGKEAPVLEGAALFRIALQTVGDTLQTFDEFKDLDQTISGNSLLVQFPKGFMGMGGFGKAHAKVLVTVYGGVRRIPSLESGWVGYLFYDRDSRVLNIRAEHEGERPPTGWTPIAV